MGAKVKFISPMLCQLEREPFDNKDWIFERKLDGVRLIAVKRGKEVALYTRNQKNRARQFPEVVFALKAFSGDFVLDGEAVVYDKRGVSSFQMIQPRIQQTSESKIKRLAKDSPAVYEAFDLLVLDGKELKTEALLKRKEFLRKIIKDSRAVKYLPHILGAGRELFRQAKKKGWEGIVGKRKDSKYLPGKRGHGWVKIKAVNEQEFVIGGFTKGYGKAAGSFGALLVGYYPQRSGKVARQQDGLVFAGEVGTGYTEEERRKLKGKLSRLKTARSPFKNPPRIKEVTWIKPVLVGQFKFAEWTRDNILRVPVYLGLRTDKKAREVVREN